MLVGTREARRGAVRRGAPPGSRDSSGPRVREAQCAAGRTSE